MKINVAVAGYGNLGKCLEKVALADDGVCLKGVLSRRKIASPYYIPFENASSLDDVDVVLLALGSYSDITQNIVRFAKFNTVDSFDTHADMCKYRNLLQEVKGNTLSVFGVGWDPGVLSLCRGLFSVGGGTTTTFWGKGISQGHSNAIRSVSGVIDAVEITVPNPVAKSEFLQGETPNANDMHTRLCYIACQPQDKERISETVRQLPNYFAGQKTEIMFCSKEEVEKIKEQKSHCGEVVARSDAFESLVHLQVRDNVYYTAKIMLCYAKAIPQMKKDGFVGALDSFDIPMKYLAPKSLI